MIKIDIKIVWKSYKPLECANMEKDGCCNYLVCCLWINFKLMAQIVMNFWKNISSLFKKLPKMIRY